jgi:glycosyltransferase involved in cell wall biosynthesis
MRVRDVCVAITFGEFRQHCSRSNGCWLPGDRTPQEGLSQVVHDSECGVVCDDSPEALSIAMQRIANNPKLAATMGSRGQRIVREQFLWPRVAARMNDAYTDIAHGRA